MNSVEIFSKVLEAEQIITDTDSLHRYGKDWLKEFTPNPSCILFPRSTSEVQEIVRLCNEHSIPLVPSGGRTGYSGGATATNKEVVLSLERMNKILEINTDDFSVRCQAGVITEVLQNKLRENNLYFPLDLSSKGSSQIGGNIATNAGGIHVLKYGNTRDWVSGLEVITGSGELLAINQGLIKNRTGYDFLSLFTGSEGTLGIVVEATLRVIPLPTEKLRILCALKSNEAILQLLRSSRQGLADLSAFEYFSRFALELVMKHHNKKDPFDDAYPTYAVLEVESNQQIDVEAIENYFCSLLEQEIVSDVVVAQSGAQSDELMSYRELISETLATHYVVHKNDVSVRVGDGEAFLQRFEELKDSEYGEIKAVIFGHIGDGNFHVTLIKPEGMSDQQFFEDCKKKDVVLFTLIKEFSGSVSAEHGVGLLKKEYLHYSRSPEEISLMKGVKNVFDPGNILNPGKIFDID